MDTSFQTSPDIIKDDYGLLFFFFLNDQKTLEKCNITMLLQNAGCTCIFQVYGMRFYICLVFLPERNQFNKRYLKDVLPFILSCST